MIESFMSATRKLYQALGELELGRVERSSDNEIVVHTQSLRTKEWRSITLRVEEAEPHGVTVIELRSIPNPPKPADEMRSVPPRGSGWVS
jgi:hypothetical protein